MANNFRDYVAMVRPERRDDISDETIHCALASIADLHIILARNGIFEFQASVAAFREAKQKLGEWCQIQRERFLWEE